MKIIKVSMVVMVLYCSFLVHVEASYLDPMMSDSQNTWLGWYDAGLNTLPEQQGWTVINNPPATQPSIQDNVLYSNSIELQYLYWTQTDKYICFPDSHGIVVEFQLKINSSQYILSSDRWRTGYSVWVSDYQGRTFRIGIADTGVILSNDYDWLNINSSSFVPYNTTNGFHLYRFVIQDNIGQLQIDGNKVVSLEAGSVNATTPNMVLFGDATMLASHDAEMTYIRYGVITKTGDTDDNGIVDIRDLARIVDYWLTGNCGCMSCCEGADINHSGKVDLEDLAILSLGWLG
jgi:hypothetical protein